MASIGQRYFQRGSARLPNWNYGWAAGYFITINTRGRIPHFGEILHRHVVVNEIGRLVETEWLKTPELRPDMHLVLGAFVVMPDHFHAILLVGKNEFNVGCPEHRYRVGADFLEVDEGYLEQEDWAVGIDAMHRVDSNCVHPNGRMNQFGPQSKNLASIVRGFKSAVTIQARSSCPDFGWQPRFYERIIRDERAYRSITRYILFNPWNTR